MEHGRIVQQGTHEELYAQEGLYRQLIEDGDNRDGNL
jgi:ABC-type multidrug transport system fused ATPase/permease subunit